MKVYIDDIKDTCPEKKLVEYLLDKKMTVTFAESCTGGLVSKKVTDVSGASGCFDCGFVTYSNQMKSKLLGVSEKTLERYGAVSSETAYEMCGGAKSKADADVAVSLTGIAGPGGGTPEKPVGLVYVGVCTDKIHSVCRLELKGDRETVRESAANCALDIVYKAVCGMLETVPGDLKTIDTEYV